MPFGGGGGFNNQQGGGGFGGGGGRGRGRGGGGYQGNNYQGGGGYQGNNYQGGGGGGFGGNKGGGGRYNNDGGGRSRGRGRGRQYDNWGGKGGGGGKGGKPSAAQLPNRHKVLQGHADTVSSIDVCDERMQFFSGSTDGTVRVWSWEGGDFNCVNTVQAGAPVECVLVFAPWLFAGTAALQGNQKCAAAPAASHAHSSSAHTRAHVAERSRSHHFFFILSRSGVVRAWNMDTGFEQSLEGHTGGIYCLAQGGAYLFSGGDDKGVKTWQYAEDRFAPLVELSGHAQPVQVLRTVGEVLLSADRGGTIAKWGLTDGTLKSTFQTGHTAPMMSMWVEESYLFTAALDGNVKVWDMEGAQQYSQVVTNQNNQPSGIAAMIVVPEGESQVLITACDDKALKLWMMPTFDKRGILASRVGHSDVVRCLARGPGNSFFSGGMDNTIIVWEFMS